MKITLKTNNIASTETEDIKSRLLELNIDAQRNEAVRLITTQMRKFIGSKIVALILLDQESTENHHHLVGTSPERKRNILDQTQIQYIAENSHSIDSSRIFNHNPKGTGLEQLFYGLGGNSSIIVPLEYRNHRVGLLLLIDIQDIHNIKSVIDSLDALSGILALELRNANLFQNLEETVAKRTRQLSESEKHFRTIIEQASDGILINDKSSKFTDVNTAGCKMFGYSEDEFTKLSIADILTEDAVKHLNEVIKTIKNDGIVRNELQFKRKDQSVFLAEIVVKKISDGKMMATIHDVTEQKLANEEVKKLNEELEQKVIERTNELQTRSLELLNNQKALINLLEDLNEKSEELTKKSDQLQLTNKELEAFSYSVSHDLRAPLRAINGFIRILLDEYDDKLDEEGKRICGIIETNSIKMGQLIDDLLSFSRLGRFEIRYTTIDMDQIVHQTIEELAADYRSKKINFNVEKLPMASGDISLIRQVWVNLISNAIKYSSMNEEINIQIGVDQKDSEIVYYIRDNGIGFDMNYAHKLFGVFQRLHNMREFDGTGVGLAIVQRVVLRHQGRVWAESNVGQGATFYFSLPVLQKDVN